LEEETTILFSFWRKKKLQFYIGQYTKKEKEEGNTSNMSNAVEFKKVYSVCKSQLDY